MTKPSLRQQILPIKSPSGRTEYERYFVQIDDKIGSVKLNIRSRYKLKETKEVYKLNKSSKLFKLKVKKRKKNIDLNVSAGKSFAPRQATTGKQNILFSSLTPDKANNSCLTLRRKEKEITLNYGNELLIS